MGLQPPATSVPAVTQMTKTATAAVAAYTWLQVPGLSPRSFARLWVFTQVAAAAQFDGGRCTCWSICRPLETVWPGRRPTVHLGLFCVEVSARSGQYGFARFSHVQFCNMQC